jgi:hypothetical protein
MRRSRPSALALLFVVAFGASARATAEPWRLDDAVGLSDRVSIDFQHRVRYEHLWDQFRPVLGGNDDIVLLRTLIHGRLRLMDWLDVGAELQDSRALDGENSGFVSNSLINPAELLQAYAEFGFDEVAGGRLQLRGGRFTLNIGSRRLASRNGFRNTISSFTGLDATWKSEALTVRGFWTLPVQRLPFRLDELRDNEVDFDEESFDFHFWGLYADGELPWGDSGELYLFGLHADENTDPPRRRRDLYTPGFRIYRRPAPGRFDYQIETALQVGRSRQATSGAGTLDHFAHFFHAELGYSFGTTWSPRVVVQYDYASGDNDPDDGDNERFDTLFGDRSFDFGHTSIYGPFARANLFTPGVRVQVKPTPKLSAYASFRAFWLASRSDVWAGGGIRDPDGDSGRYVGSQIEMRVRWRIFPKNVTLEGGYAHLFAGEFMDDAPTSPSRGGADYVYTQIVFEY